VVERATITASSRSKPTIFSTRTPSPASSLANASSALAGVGQVAELARLQHQRPAQVAPGSLQVGGGLGDEEARHRQAGVEEHLLLGRLVLDHRDRGGRGADRRAGGLDRLERRGLDELVLERHDRRRPSECRDRLGVVPVALDQAVRHRRGRLVGRAEDRDADAEGPRRQARHARQLARPRDPDVGGTVLGRAGRRDRRERSRGRHRCGR
jgi:hypothetical protein